MAEPAPSHHRPLPPPYAAVQPRPRRPAGPNRRGPPNEEWPVYGPEDLSPYPIWSVLIVRGTLTAFGIATLGYVAHLHAMAQSLGLRSDATIAIAGGALSVFLDAVLTLFAAVGAYEAGTSCTSGFLDIVPAVICLVGALGMSWPERHGEEQYDAYYHARSLGATLLIVLGVLHILSSVSGCVGCCITSSRHGRAKREKRMVEAAVAAAEQAEAQAAAPPPPPVDAAAPDNTPPAAVPVEEAPKTEPDAAAHVENPAPGAEETNPDGSPAQKA